jgi:hypothetical protein
VEAVTGVKFTHRVPLVNGSGEREALKARDAQAVGTH